MHRYINKYKIFADINRVRMLNILINSSDKLSISDLSEILNLPLYTISKNMKILKNIALISVTKKGRFTYIQLNNYNKDFDKKLLDSVLLINNPILKKDLDNFEKFIINKLKEEIK